MLSHFYDKAAGSLDEDDDDIPEIATDIDQAYAQLLTVCTVSIAWWLYFQIVKLIKIWFLTKFTNNLLQFLNFLR